MVFTKVSVCLSVGRILDNSRYNYRIELSFGILYWSRKSKDEFVKQPHPIKIVEIRAFFVFSKMSMLRFKIISHHFKKLNKFFKRYIITNEDFRNIKTIEISIEKYSQISVYMTCCSIIYLEQQLSLLLGSSFPIPVQKFWWGANWAPIGKNVAPIG